METSLLEEICRRPLSYDKITSASLSVENNLILLRMEKNLIILDLTCSPFPYCADINFYESNIQCPNISHVTSELSTYSKTFKDSFQLYELVANPELWPHSQAMVDSSVFTSIHIFPPEFFNEHQKIIAIITNMGHLEILQCTNKTWDTIVDVSLKIKKISEKKSDLIERVKALETAAVCYVYAPITQSHYLLTAQRNGDILFWTINRDEMSIKLDFFEKINVDSNDVSTLQAMYSFNDKLILIYSEVNGKVHLLEVKLKPKIELVKTACIWEHSDKMTAKFMHYDVSDQKLMIIFVKYRHLVIVSYSIDGVVKVELMQNINDHKIVSFFKHKNLYVIATENFVVHHITFNFSSKIQCQIEEIKTKPVNSEYELHNLRISENSLFFYIIASKPNRNRKLHTTSLLIFLNKTVDYIKMILDNPSKSLTSIYDCIEWLRLTVLKSKTLPNIDFIKLYNESQTDIYKSKVYYIILKLYHEVKIDMLFKFIKDPLPESSIDRVQDLILYLHASNILNKINQSYKTNKCKLSSLEQESIVFIRDYFNNYCKKYECKLPQSLVSILDSIVVPIPKIVCSCCDDKYDGQWYGSRHINVFCSVSFTPITDDNILHCKRCNFTARDHKDIGTTLCTFCDLPFS